MLPADKQPEGLLEIFLLGGLGPWESFYVVPEFGAPSAGVEASQWWCFQNTGTPTLQQWLDTCLPSQQPLLQPFGQDSRGKTVNLGPFVQALRNRPDLLKRMRVWVMSHDLEPHEAATPLAMTGHVRGNPRGAALGTHLGQFFNESGPARALPNCYTLFMDSFNATAGNNGDSASAVGLHRASARPLALQLPATLLTDRLPRPSVAGFRNELDALVDYYAARTSSDFGINLRQPGVDDFAFARAAMRQADALGSVLSAELLTSELIKACHIEKMSPLTSPVEDQPTTGINLARHLLTLPDEPARYVQLVDGGLWTDEEGIGYDSHSNHVERQGTNLNHICQLLSDSIAEPGDDDPSKLNLDKHMILLNSEFGRAPTPETSVRNPHGTGSDHWPWGYVVVGFGGPIDEERSGIVGSIGENGRAIDFTTPGEHRAAMMQMMGAWPFSESTFAVGDVRDVQTEIDAAVRLKEMVLGYSE
ncbi:MAG: hypothetical protein ACI9OJ_005486 [Myxococcota bacterium]|jgi:hypothetical protein